MGDLVILFETKFKIAEHIDGQKAKCRNPHFCRKCDFSEILNFILFSCVKPTVAGADRATGTPGFSRWAVAYIEENGPMKNITINTIIYYTCTLYIQTYIQIKVNKYYSTDIFIYTYYLANHRQMVFILEFGFLVLLLCVMTRNCSCHQLIQYYRYYRINKDYYYY